METMYDSTEPFDIPADAKFVAGYRDGEWAWSDAGWARFPHASSISVYPFCTPAEILDVEASDAGTPAARKAAEKWVGDRLATRGHPIIYTSLATVDNFRGLYCSFWLAHYTGSPHMVSVAGLDVIGTQYASPSTGSGGHYDLTLMSDRWVAGWPGKAPDSMAGKMLHFEQSPSGKGYWVVTVDGVYAYGDVADVAGHPDPMLTAERFFAFVATPTGRGYRIVDVNGNVFDYGDAEFYGHP